MPAVRAAGEFPEPGPPVDGIELVRVDDFPAMGVEQGQRRPEVRFGEVLGTVAADPGEVEQRQRFGGDMVYRRGPHIVHPAVGAAFEPAVEQAGLGVEQKTAPGTPAVRQDRRKVQALESSADNDPLVRGRRTAGIMFCSRRRGRNHHCYIRHVSEIFDPVYQNIYNSYTLERDALDILNEIKQLGKRERRKNGADRQGTDRSD